MHRKYVLHTKNIPCSVVRGGGGSYKNGGRTCPDCKKTYRNPSSFSKHRCCGKKTKSFVCNICMASFTQNWSLNRHMTTIHKEGSEEKSQRRQCLEEGCSQNFYKVSSLYDHLEHDHSWQCKTELKIFPSFSDFEKWKEAEDKDHYMNMYKTTKKIKVETAYRYFTCNFQRTQPQWEQDDRVKGSWKCGITPALQCPARMMCRINSGGEVEVRYLKTHNHVCDGRQLNHVHMHKSDLNEIKQKIQQGVDIDRIQSDCQGDFGECLQRGTERDEKKFYLSRKQIRNIRRNIMRHRESDFKSVKNKLFHLHKQKYSPVVVWKPNGEAAAIGKSYLDMEKDVVAIGLQTKEQLLMLNEGGHRIVCIDATYGTNRYGYSLLNIVVPTAFKKGYPVASFILSRITKEVLIAIFKMIKDKFIELGIDFRPKIVMTDDDQMTGPAFQQVFGPDVLHFLCHWHIKKSWGENMSKVKNEENRVVIKQLLQEMLEEPSLEKFSTMLQNFLDKFTKTEPIFAEYLKTYYVPRQALWAQAYRDIFHAGTDTNMYSESQFNKLKTYYMHRKPTRRIDDLMDKLMKMEMDAYINHRKNNELGVQPEIPLLLSDRHEESRKISDDEVMQCENGWLVQSQTTQNIFYHIIRTLDECSCIDRCLHCSNLCPHMFRCGCPYKHSICKHVHKLSTCLQNGTSLQFATLQQEETSEVEMLVILNSTDSKDLREFPLVENEPLQPKETSEAGLLVSLNLTEPEGDTNVQVGEPADAQEFLFTETAETITPACKLKKQKRFRKTPKTKTQTISREFPLTNAEQIKAQRRKEKKIEKLAARRKTRRAPQETSNEACGNEPPRVTNTANGSENLIIFSPLQMNSPTSFLMEQDFGAPLKDGKDPVLNNTYKIGNRFVDTTDLKGIDAELDHRQVHILQKKDRGFLAGCLTDRIIDAYFHVILRGSRIAALTSRWYQDLNEGTFTIPFAVSEYEKILIPSNPTKNHWVLFVYSVQNRSWEFFNPTQFARLGGVYLSALQQLHHIFNRGGELKVITPKHIYQKDSDGTGCGVYTCFYGKQCRNKEPYDIPLAVHLFRKEIYHNIATYIEETSQSK